jgi:DnaK suppressor protein
MSIPTDIEFAPYSLAENEEYMNDQQANHFDAILLKWKENLIVKMNSTVHHLQDDGENFPDPSDRATQEEEFSLELRTRDRERKLIKKIEASLSMIAKGEYGFCETCGAEIGLRRLEARPTATQCVECKTLDEVREKQHA